MKQLEFKPAVTFEPYVKLPFQKPLNAKDSEKESTDLNLLAGSEIKTQIQEKLPLGVETGMVYIAVPISMIVWIGIIYAIKTILF